MNKPSFRRALKRLFFIALCGAIPVLLGYLGFRFMFAYVTSFDTSSSIGELSDIILNYISIAVTIILGVIVYIQAERINKLEATQYGVFLGAERLDQSSSPAAQFLSLNPSQNPLEKIHLFEVVDNSRLGLLINVSLSEGKDGSRLPFVFVTRNSPLITSLTIKHIDLRIDYFAESRKRPLEKQYPISANPVYKFLSDQSEFDLAFSINGVPKKQIEKVKFAIIFSVEDQFDRKHSIKSEITVEQRYDEFCLLSSKSSALSRY